MTAASAALAAAPPLLRGPPANAVIYDIADEGEDNNIDFIPCPSGPAVLACGTTKKLLASLPRGASGVAGLAGSGLALPAQVASSQKVARKFLLCLPGGGANGDGVAIFGGGPLYLLEGQPELTQSLEYTPLLTKKDSPAYYVTAKYIALDNSRVPLPPRALTTGSVALRTTVPYTALRAYVYRPFMAAFGKAMAAQWQYARAVKPVAPFGLCYDARTLVNAHNG
ncbi:hypothetical protein ACQ4PT_044311 [Festuca glaucescens]